MRNSSNQHFVSIIIPALNEEKVIGKCLNAIKRLDTSKESFEVILVDNGSVDKTCGIAESFKYDLDIKIFTIPGVNISALRNAGASHSKGDILAFVDADCTASPNWINNAAKYFDQPKIGAVGSSYDIPENSSWVAKCWDLNSARKRKLGEAEYLPAGNLFVTKEKFLEIGGFKEDLITNEDYEFCYRLRKMGLRVYADPDISVVHWGVPQNLVHFYKRQKWLGTHVLKVFLDNIGELKNFRAVSYAIYYTCCIICFFLSLLISFTVHNFLLLTIVVFALLSPPLLLSIKTLNNQKQSYRYSLRLSILYFVYGIARAMSILDNFRIALGLKL